MSTRKYELSYSKL